MKKMILPFLALAGMLNSCSYNQFSGIVAGSSLGGTFASSIGGLMNGPRGHDKGAVIGMVAGGVIGAIATAPRDNNSSSRSQSDDYGYDEADYAPAVRSSSSRSSRLAEAEAFAANLEVGHLRFRDANRNQCLDAGEQATIEMEIHNRGEEDLFNVSPVVTCDNRHILISAPAMLQRLPAGRGFRYTVAVAADKRLKEGEVLFTIAFGSGKHRVPVRNFRLRTAR